MLVLLMFAGFGLFAAAKAREMRHGGDEGLLERTAAALHLTLFVSIAVNWLLSAVHAVRPLPLLGVAVVLGAVGLRSLRRAGRLSTWTEPLVRVAGMNVVSWLCLLLPFLGWLGFVGFRSLVVPVGSHDALSYHLPRAVDVALHGGFRLLDVEDFRLRTFPVDYELLLADVLILGGGEHGASLLSVFFYICACVTIAAFVERHWRRASFALLAALLWAGAPLALLHSGAVKNDLPAMIFAVGAALWGARALATGATFAWALVAVDLALGLGTKSTGLFPVIAFLAVAIGSANGRKNVASSFRTFAARWRALPLSLRLSSPLAAFLFAYVAGAAPYLAMLLPSSIPFDREAAWQNNVTPRWGQLSNLFEFPYLVFARPFSASPLFVSLPWRGQMWFWPKYEIYFSSFGCLVTTLLVFVPLAILVRRRATPAEAIVSPPRAGERRLAQVILLLSVALLLPLHYRTEGFFNGYPRYVFFLPLLVIDAGLLPLLARVSGGRIGIAMSAVFAMVGAAFVFEAIDMGTNDRFAPLAYVLAQATHPDSRRLAFANDRAEQVLDRMAGPADVVVLDAGFGAWVYPVYGIDLTRRVAFLPPGDEARARMLETADWVAIDRSWNRVWGSPDLTDMGKFSQFVDEGALLPSDLRTETELLADPRFERVYDLPLYNQVVFKRRR